MARCSVPPKLAIFLIIAVTLILLLPAFGLTFGHPLESSTDQYYVDKSEEKTGYHTVVTAIMFDFRGFDTLGEATELFIAVLGGAMFFREGN